MATRITNRGYGSSLDGTNVGTSRYNFPTNDIHISNIDHMSYINETGSTNFTASVEYILLYSTGNDNSSVEIKYFIDIAEFQREILARIIDRDVILISFNDRSKYVLSNLTVTEIEPVPTGIMPVDNLLLITMNAGTYSYVPREIPGYNPGESPIYETLRDEETHFEFRPEFLEARCMYTGFTEFMGAYKETLDKYGIEKKPRFQWRD